MKNSFFFLGVLVGIREDYLHIVRDAISHGRAILLEAVCALAQKSDTRRFRPSGGALRENPINSIHPEMLLVVVISRIYQDAKALGQQSLDQLDGTRCPSSHHERREAGRGIKIRLIQQIRKHGRRSV